MSDQDLEVGDAIPENMSHLYTVDTDPESFTDPDKEDYRVERVELRDDLVDQLERFFEEQDVGVNDTLYIQTASGNFYMIRCGYDTYEINLLNPNASSFKEEEFVDFEVDIHINRDRFHIIEPLTDADVSNMRFISADLEGTYEIIYKYDLEDIDRANESLNGDGPNLEHSGYLASQAVKAKFEELKDSETVETEKVTCEKNISTYSALASLMPEGVHFFEIGIYDKKYKVTRIGEDFRVKVTHVANDYDEELEYKYATSIWVDKRGNEDSDSCISKEDVEELQRVFPMLFVQNKTGEVLDA